MNKMFAIEVDQKFMEGKRGHSPQTQNSNKLLSSKYKEPEPQTAR